MVFFEGRAVEGERLFAQTANGLDPENPSQAVALRHGTG